MNITIDGRSLFWYRGTGMGTYTYNLTQGLRGANHHHYHLLFPENQEYSLDETTWDTPQEVFDFWERVYDNPPLIPKGSHVFHNPHNGFGLPYSEDIPKVTTIHDVIPLLLKDYCGSPYRENFIKEMPKILANTNHIIAASKRTKEDIVKHYKVTPKKISVIYQGVEPIFTPINQQTAAVFLKREYHIEEDFILSVGGFNKRKNLTTLIDAFEKIKEDVPWNLIILGKEGKQSATLKNQVKELSLEDRIFFLGYIPRHHLPYFYSKAKLFVFPSLYEGFGLPPLEAASCGCPVMLSNTSSLTEVLANHGHYINPKNCHHIAKGMLDLYHHKEERIALGREALYHSRQFSPLIAARKTLAVYENLCR